MMAVDVVSGAGQWCQTLMGDSRAGHQSQQQRRPLAGTDFNPKFHMGPSRSTHLQHRHQQLHFLSLRAALQRLCHVGCGHTDTPDLDLDGLVEVLRCQLLNLLWHGGTEQQRLVGHWQALQQHRAATTHDAGVQG